MKAVVLENYGSPPQLVYREFPERSPGADEVVIATAAVSVNPADWKLCAGFLREVLPKTLPLIPGLDVSGTVVAVGAAVTKLQVGDVVAGALSPLDSGSYAERVTAPARYFAKIPAGQNLIESAAIPTAGLTGLQLIERGVQAKAGQRILITGATGGVGRAALCVAKALGCHVIAAVRARQHEQAIQLGADECVDPDDANALAALAPVDAIADTVGGRVADAVLPRLKAGGILSTVATDPITPRPDLPVTLHRTIFMPDAADLARVMNFIGHGQLSFPIAHTLKFSEVVQAHQLQQQGGLAGKVLLIPDPVSAI